MESEINHEGGKMKEKDFDIAMEKHLRREELLFRAKNKPKGSNVSWLAPSCDSLDDIVNMLRWLGFRIKEVFDDMDCTGHEMRRVETTSGVIVWVNSELSRGFVCGRVRLE